MKGGHLDPHLERQPCDNLTGLSCPVWDISSRRSRELTYPRLLDWTTLPLSTLASAPRPQTLPLTKQACFNISSGARYHVRSCCPHLTVVLTPSPTPTDLRKESIGAEISLTTAPHLQALPELAAPLKTNHLWHLDLVCPPVLTACRKLNGVANSETSLCLVYAPAPPLLLFLMIMPK